MQPADYRRIESELQQHIKQANLAGAGQPDLLSRKGWSTGCLGQSASLLWFSRCRTQSLTVNGLDVADDSDDEFHPFSTSRPSADKSTSPAQQPSSSPNG